MNWTFEQIVKPWICNFGTQFWYQLCATILLSSASQLLLLLFLCNNIISVDHNYGKLSWILDDSTSVWITNVCVQQYYQPQSQLLLLLCNILLASITIVRSCHGYWMIPLMWEHLIRVPLCSHEVISNGWKIYLNCSSNAIFHIPSSFFQASKARLRKKFDIIFPFGFGC